MIYELEGRDALFHPFITKKPESILWKHNGNKVVETGATWEKIYGSYEGRIILNLLNARLLISDLRLEDSGEYELEIFTRGKWKLFPKMELKVLEWVAKPSISCHMNSSSSSSSKVSAVLQCSAGLSQTDLLQFQWISGGKVQPGNNLTILLGGELDEQQYTCEVSNRLSQESSTFTAKDCNAGAGLLAGWIALIVSSCLIGIICFSVLLICYIVNRRRKKKGAEEKTEDKQQVELEPCLNPEEESQQLPPEGNVKRKAAAYNQLSSSPQHKTNITPKKNVLHQKSLQNKNQSPQPAVPSSPPPVQLAATNSSEPGDRVPQLDDEDLSLLTQNRENVTPQTADDEHDKELNADTRPPTMNERRGSDVSGGREEPMSPPENADQGEDHQHQTDCEESAGEDEAATSGRVVEEEGFSGDPGNPSRGEKSDDAGHSDDKGTQPPAATEQIGSEASED